MSSVPDDFNVHAAHLTDLTGQIEDEQLRQDLRAAIEELANGMRGPWRNCWVIWTSIPDDLEGLFDA